MYVRSADKLVGISAVFPECEVVLMKLQGKLSTAAKQLTSSHSVTATEIYPSKVETSHSTTKSHQNSELNFYFWNFHRIIHILDHSCTKMRNSIPGTDK